MSDLSTRLADLSPEKRELVLKKLQKQNLIPERDKGRQPPPIMPIPRDRAIPLSFAQERLWFLSQLMEASAVYNMPAALRLTGTLNITALGRSINEIIRRHETLRTTFVTKDGFPVQLIAPALSIPVSVMDLQQLPEVEQSAEVQRLATEEAQRPFDLSKGPLLRVTLLQLAEEEHVLLLTMHHIISDEWSIGIFIKEFAVLYKAFSKGRPSPLPELSIQYADFTHWQRQWLQGEMLEVQLNYWKQQLAGDLPVIELPTDRPRPVRLTFQGATQTFMFSRTLSDTIKSLSRQEGVTLFMILLAAFKTLLYRYTAQDNIIVGTAFANRKRAEIEALIGFFVNTIVLRDDLSGNPTFRELLSQVRETTLGAQDHQDMPFERLVTELRPKRELSRQPLFQVMFILQNTPMQTLELPGLTLTPLEIDNKTAKFDLTLVMEETELGLRGSLEYNTDLFDAATMTRMIGHFRTLMEGIVANPEQQLSELPILTEAERHQILVEWNDTTADYPKDRCLHELFEAQVEQTPDAVALIFEEQQLTYHELNSRANQLAHYLRKLGVGSEVLVGICLERSLEMIVGLLGILKAGGAYVPLDPAYPKERLAFMVGDTQTRLMLTQQRLAGKLVSDKIRIVCLDSDWEVISRESRNNFKVDVKPENLAYVIYTSGSTGIPKGVAIEHHSPIALIYWAKSIYSYEELAGVLVSTSICFDLSIYEIFLTLAVGGTMILVRNILELPTLKTSTGVTLINTVPSAIKELLHSGGIPSSVCIVNLAGEPLSASLVDRIYEIPTIRKIYDLYGPSEDTTYSTYSLRQKNGITTIGRPIANTQVYILDRHLKPVPIGIPGELYISGDGLARGYLNRPNVTSKKFIPTPFLDKPEASSEFLQRMRLYKTGDLTRYLQDGNIEFLGRIDHQVKIRGFRIELGEIEATLAKHIAVKESVVMAREDIPDNKRLVAYVVSEQEQVLSSGELRDFLKKSLPDFMIPSVFVMLEALPLTPNGKIDRRALPAPNGLRSELETTYVRPQTETERRLVQVWQEALHVEKIGIHDNFFDLGGHSLLAAKIHRKLQDESEQSLSIIDLFQYPTIHALARHIHQKQDETLSPEAGQTHAQRRRAYQDSIQQSSQRRRQHRTAKQKGGTSNE